MVLSPFVTPAPFVTLVSFVTFATFVTNHRWWGWLLQKQSAFVTSEGVKAK